MKYLWNRSTDLRQIHMEDMLGPSLGRVHGRHVWSLVWKSLKVKVIGDKNGIFDPFGGLRAVCL